MAKQIPIETYLPLSGPLPKWKCHKVVRAAKILEFELVDGVVRLLLDLPEGARYVSGTQAWEQKHQPVPGGYFVEYEDGYQSFSPAQAFEEGYTRLPEPAPAGSPEG